MPWIEYLGWKVLSWIENVLLPERHLWLFLCLRLQIVHIFTGCWRIYLISTLKTFLMSQINALSEVSLAPSLFVTFHGSNHRAVMTKVMIRSGYWIILTQSGKNVNNWTLIQTAVILKFQPKNPNCQLI